MGTFATELSCWMDFGDCISTMDESLRYRGRIDRAKVLGSMGKMEDGRRQSWKNVLGSMGMLYLHPHISRVRIPETQARGIIRSKARGYR